MFRYRHRKALIVAGPMSQTVGKQQGLGVFKVSFPHVLQC